MGFFVRAVAVFVGLLNTYLAEGGGDLTAPLKVDPAGFLRVVVVAIVAGLLAAEVVLRVMRPALEGKFLFRYAVMVLAVQLGGLLVGTLMGFAILLDSTFSLAERVPMALVVAFVGSLWGGVIGTVEGLIFAFPLAVILGLFRNNNGSRSGSTAT